MLVSIHLNCVPFLLVKVIMGFLWVIIFVLYSIIRLWNSSRDISPQNLQSSVQILHDLQSSVQILHDLQPSRRAGRELVSN